MPRPTDDSDGHELVRHRGSGGRIGVVDSGDAARICQGGGEEVEGGNGVRGVGPELPYPTKLDAKRRK
jgi:hypothetical protein